MRLLNIKYRFNFDTTEKTFLIVSYLNEDKETIKKAIEELKEIINKNYLCYLNNKTYKEIYKNNNFIYKIQLKLLYNALNK